MYPRVIIGIHHEGRGEDECNVPKCQRPSDEAVSRVSLKQTTSQKTPVDFYTLYIVVPYVPGYILSHDQFSPEFPHNYKDIKQHNRGVYCHQSTSARSTKSFSFSRFTELYTQSKNRKHLRELPMAEGMPHFRHYHDIASKSRRSSS